MPNFLTLLVHFGVDPVFFGILVALHLQTPFLMPPMAMSACCRKGLAPLHVRLSTTFRGCLRFVSMAMAAMAGITRPRRCCNGWRNRLAETVR